MGQSPSGDRLTGLAARLALLLSLGFALALGALRIGASSTPPSARLAAVMGDCGIDCWHDIHLGDATADLRDRLGVNLAFADCFNILSQDCGAQFNLPATEQSGSVEVIAARGQVKQVLAHRPAITLGEALLSQGRPSYVAYGTAQGTDRFFGYFGYAGNSLMLTAEVECPADFGTLLRQPLSTISLQLSYAASANASTYADLRRAFEWGCGGA